MKVCLFAFAAAAVVGVCGAVEGAGEINSYWSAQGCNGRPRSVKKLP
jgi:hypothetical protein